MFKKFAWVALIATPLAGICAEPQHEVAQPRQALRAVASAPAASAPVAARKTPGNRQHQLMSACNKQLENSGLSGAARKKAMSDCLKNS
jgi:hypothetical protein